MRKRISIGLGIMLLACCGVLLFALSRPAPNRQCFDRLKVGMTFAKVRQIVEDGHFVVIERRFVSGSTLAMTFDSSEGDTIIVYWDWLDEPIRLTKCEFRPKQRTFFETLERLWSGLR